MQPLRRLYSGKESERGNKPYPRSRIAEEVWQKIKEKHDFAPLSEESLENLSLANELLKTQSIIMYANHTSKKDAEVAVALALSHLTNAKRLMAPAGMKHYDFFRDWKSALKMRALRLINIRIIPVVQHDDLDRYSPKKRARMLNRLKKRAQSLLSKAGGIYGITPEGTRSKKTFKLLPARSGIGKVGKYAPDEIRYIPLGIIYKNQSDQPEVVVGKPQTLHEVLSEFGVSLPVEFESRAQKIADLMMYRLSLLLPENIRGHYKDYTP